VVGMFALTGVVILYGLYHMCPYWFCCRSEKEYRREELKTLLEEETKKHIEEMKQKGAEQIMEEKVKPYFQYDNANFWNSIDLKNIVTKVNEAVDSAVGENFEVTSPHSVLGTVGQDTILPCHVSSTKSLDIIEVQWKKITDEHIEVICIYRQFGGNPTQKYLGRTSLPADGFATEHEDLKTRCDALSRELVPITLDEAWKHPELAVSSDQRTVEHKPSAHRPTIKGQFPAVVGREGFAFGYHYWEVKVWDGLDWELGVLTETARDRLKERSWKELPEDGIWSLRRVEGEYWPEEAKAKMCRHTDQLTVVGLHLDLKQNTLSFYDIGTSDCILKIPIKGSTKLYPFFRPGLAEAGEKGEPLTINHNTDWDFPNTVSVK
ncbi:PREDICTED: E3 ubiquitin-protein ligase TRIM39-like, partial [Eurypyga helias]|uniref:E3 ubiquitin-protein ligase TRIM39-like n=1 Tax=Eurypyga helias TaxID=54383 RepID=UPI000528FEB6